MNIGGVLTAAFVVSFIYLMCPISCRPTQTSYQTTTLYNLYTNSPKTELTTDDSSEENTFDVHNDPGDFDVYDNSDSTDSSEDSFNSDSSDDSLENKIESNDFRGDKINPTERNHFPQWNVQNDEEQTEHLLTSRQNVNSKEFTMFPKSAQRQEVDSDDHSETNVGSTRQTNVTPDNNNNNNNNNSNNNKHESEESEEITNINSEKTDQKRQGAELDMHACSNDGNTSSGTEVALGDGEVRRTTHGQPCTRNDPVHNSNEDLTQNNAVLVTMSSTEVEAFARSPNNVERENTRNHHTNHSVDVSSSNELNLRSSLHSFRGENSNHTEIVEENIDNSSNHHRMIISGNTDYSAVISGNEVNLSNASLINIQLPDLNGSLSNDIRDRGKTDDQSDTSDRHAADNVNRDEDLKPNESGGELQLSSLDIQSQQVAATSTSMVGLTLSTATVLESVPSHLQTQPIGLFPSSSSYVNFYISNSIGNTLVSELSDRLMHSSNKMSVSFPQETIQPELLHPTLSLTSVIAETSKASRTNELLSVETESSQSQVTTSLQYEPSQIFPSGDHRTTTKTDITDNDNNERDKVHTKRISITQIQSVLSTPTASVINLSQGLSHEITSTDDFNIKISTEFSQLYSSDILSTTIIATPTTIAASTSVYIHEDSSKTSESAQTASTSPTINTSTQPTIPVSQTTPDLKYTTGNWTPDEGYEESPSSYITLTFGMDWSDFCQGMVLIFQDLVLIVHRKDERIEVNSDQLQLMNDDMQECYKAQLSQDRTISPRVYILNKSHKFDHNLTWMFAQLLNSGVLQNDNLVHKIKLQSVIHQDETLMTGNKNEHNNNDSSSSLSDPGVVIAVLLACFGACYCIGLLILQIILRHRRSPLFFKSLSHSYSATSSDSIQLSSVNKSRPNSGLFNPALDLTDSLEPSNPLPFIQLTKFCLNEHLIYDEYIRIPSRMPRLSVVPAGDEDKNRYANVLPLANTRVRLLNNGHERRSSYINANYITGLTNQSHSYIATQAPTDNTVSDFWTMIWQQGCAVIVMLTHLEENGQMKCASYWPELVGKSAAQKHGDFLIELKQKDVYQEYIASKLKINNLREIETREIDHFWYTCWPSVGIPEPISLVKLVLDTRPKYECSNSPLVVHCSPGTGRTCTFIGLDICMRQFEERKVVDVLKTVCMMRQERAGAIQNKEQYALLYHALNEYAMIVVSPAISAASSAATLLPS